MREIAKTNRSDKVGEQEKQKATGTQQPTLSPSHPEAAKAFVCPDDSRFFVETIRVLLLLFFVIEIFGESVDHKGNKIKSRTTMLTTGAIQNFCAAAIKSNDRGCAAIHDRINCGITTRDNAFVDHIMTFLNMTHERLEAGHER